MIFIEDSCGNIKWNEKNKKEWSQIHKAIWHWLIVLSF